MRISKADILQQIDDGFSSAYKPFTTFQNSGYLWDKCITAVSDIDLLRKIIFCNDILQAPPVQVFLKVSCLKTTDLTNYEKKATGAFWGYVFKVIFQYRDQQVTTINTNGVKKATYFLNPVSPVEITE